ncbi:hypothetical protein GEMRC1_013624 [Eukaryota sp. GEM-RC1]
MIGRSDVHSQAGSCLGLLLSLSVGSSDDVIIKVKNNLIDSLRALFKDRFYEHFIRVLLSISDHFPGLVLEFSSQIIDCLSNSSTNPFKNKILNILSNLSSNVPIDKVSVFLQTLFPLWSTFFNSKNVELQLSALKLTDKIVSKVSYQDELIKIVFNCNDVFATSSNASVQSEYSNILCTLSTSNSFPKSVQQSATTYLLCLVPKLSSPDNILNIFSSSLSSEPLPRVFSSLQLFSRENLTQMAKQNILQIVNALFFDIVPKNFKISSAVEGSYSHKSISLTSSCITGMTFFSQFFSTLSMSIGGTFDPSLESLAVEDNIPAVLNRYQQLEKLKDKQQDNLIKRERFSKRKVRSSSSRELSSEVSLQREYRTGELLDLELTSKDLFIPLLRLSFKDPLLSQQLLSIVLTSLLANHDDQSFDLFSIIFDCLSSIDDSGLLLVLLERLESACESSLPQSIHHKLIDNLDRFTSLSISNHIEPCLITLLETLANSDLVSTNFKSIYLSRLLPLYQHLRMYTSSESTLVTLAEYCNQSDLIGVSAFRYEISGDFNSAMDHYSADLDKLVELPSDSLALHLSQAFQEGLLRCCVRLGSWTDVVEFCSSELEGNSGELFLPPKDRVFVDPLLTSAVMEVFDFPKISRENLKLIEEVQGIVEDETSHCTSLNFKKSIFNEELPFYDVFVNFLIKTPEDAFADASSKIQTILPKISNFSNFDQSGHVHSSLSLLTEVLDLKEAQQSNTIDQLMVSWFDHVSMPNYFKFPIIQTRNLLVKIALISKYYGHSGFDFGVSSLLKFLTTEESAQIPGLVSKISNILQKFAAEIPHFADLLSLYQSNSTAQQFEILNKFRNQPINLDPALSLLNSFYSLNTLTSIELSLLNSSPSVVQTEAVRLIESVDSLQEQSRLTVKEMISMKMEVAKLAKQFPELIGHMIEAILSSSQSVSHRNRDLYLKISSWFPLIFSLLPSYPEHQGLILKYLPNISHHYLRPWMQTLISVFISPNCKEVSLKILKFLFETDLSATILSIYSFKDLLLESGLSDFISLYLSDKSIIDFIEELRFVSLPELRFLDVARGESTDYHDVLESQLRDDFVDSHSKLVGYNLQFYNQHKKLIQNFFKSNSDRVSIANSMRQNRLFTDFMKKPQRQLSEFSNNLDNFKYVNVVLEAGSSSVVTSLSSKISFLSSVRRPCKLSLILSDGTIRPLLFKSGEDLRLDQQIQRFFTIFNNSFTSNNLHHRNLVQYQVFPLTCYYSLCDWIPSTEPLQNGIMKESAVLGKLKSEYVKFYGRPQSNKGRSKEQVLDLASRLESRFSKYTLREYIKSFGRSSAEYFKILTQFRIDLATCSAAGYLVGLGDRHFGNFLIQSTTGRLCLIDFGQSFDLSLKLPIPELSPFRFSASFSGILDPLNNNTFLSSSITECLSTLRSDSSFILPLYESLVALPPQDFLKVAVVDPGRNINTLEDFNKRRVDLSIGKLRGRSPKHIAIDGFSLLHPADDLKKSVFLKSSLQALKEVESNVGDEILKPKDQASEVVNMVMDHNLLYRAYEGYLPFA